MGMLSMSSNPKELSKQIGLFESRKAAYEKAREEWLAGRKIQTVEEQAEKVLADAKVEAQAIIKSANEYVEEKQKQAEEAKELRLQAEGMVKANRINQKDLKDALREAEKARAVADQQIEEYTGKSAQANYKNNLLKTTIEGLQAHLKKVNDDLD